MPDDDEPRGHPYDPAATSTDDTEFVRRYVDRVHRFLLGLTGDDDMARDLTQETFLRLLQARRSNPTSLLGPGYVFATARNVAHSRLRRLRLERAHTPSMPVEKLEPVADHAPVADPGGTLERAELRHHLGHALDRLPEDTRAVFLLSEVEGLSYEEIANVMGCPVGTVGSRKHNAARTLRDLLRGWGVAL